jgi:hypothetical protein
MHVVPNSNKSTGRRIIKTNIEDYPTAAAPLTAMNSNPIVKIDGQVFNNLDYGPSPSELQLTKIETAERSKPRSRSISSASEEDGTVNVYQKHYGPITLSYVNTHQTNCHHTSVS